MLFFRSHITIAAIALLWPIVTEPGSRSVRGRFHDNLLGQSSLAHCEQQCGRVGRNSNRGRLLVHLSRLD